MLEEGRIRMTPYEHLALDKLAEQFGPQLTVSRRDPGNSGPLVVTNHIDSLLYEIDPDGTVRNMMLP